KCSIALYWGSKIGHFRKPGLGFSLSFFPIPPGTVHFPGKVHHKGVEEKMGTRFTREREFTREELEEHEEALAEMYRQDRLEEALSQPCWNWYGARTPEGYGVMHIGKGLVMIHRMVYLMHHDIEPDLVIDHLCRNHACYNPDHMEAVTRREENASSDGIV